MTFDARTLAEQHADDYPPFVFVGLDGVEHELPNTVTLTERQISRIRQGGMDELENLIAPEAFEAIQDLPLHISRQLGEAWFEEAGETGKSQAPSRATRRAVKPSKRTSPPAA